MPVFQFEWVTKKKLPMQISIYWVGRGNKELQGSLQTFLPLLQIKPGVVKYVGANAFSQGLGKIEKKCPNCNGIQIQHGASNSSPWNHF